MATEDQIKTLKEQWCADPCWDIESTEGFEEHREELAAYRVEKEAEWKEEARQMVEKKAEELGIPGKTALVLYILNLEEKIRKLEVTVGERAWIL